MDDKYNYGGSVALGEKTADVGVGESGRMSVGFPKVNRVTKIFSLR